MLHTIAKAAAAGILVVALQAPLMAVQAPTSQVEARERDNRVYPNRRAQHRARVCRNRGTAIGILAGAVIGNQVSDQHRTTGTVAGAAVGGAAGRAIAEDECKRKYERPRRRR